MEQKQKFHAKKEGEPRISVRPGNFIVPGEAAKPPHEPARNDKGEGHKAAGNERSGGNRHRGPRGRRGHGHGNHQGNNQNNAPRQNEARNEPVKQQAEPAAKPPVADNKKPHAQRHGRNRKADC